MIHPIESIPGLVDSSLETYQKIFQHPFLHNLPWRHVRTMLEEIAEVVEKPNGNLRVARHGQVLIVGAPKTKEITEAEIIALRHFLKRSAVPPPASSGQLGDCLVVIDHQQARVFRSDMAGTPAERILPHEPADHFRQQHHSKDFTRGQEKPDPNSFFPPVAGALQAAERILIFGPGQGSASAMQQLVNWLSEHHPELSDRITGTLAVDESHLTDAQLLAKARAYYAGDPTE